MERPDDKRSRGMCETVDKEFHKEEDETERWLFYLLLKKRGMASTLL